jgi:hypothetical protein
MCVASRVYAEHAQVPCPYFYVRGLSISTFGNSGNLFFICHVAVVDSGVTEPASGPSRRTRKTNDKFVNAGSSSIVRTIHMFVPASSVHLDPTDAAKSKKQ